MAHDAGADPAMRELAAKELADLDERRLVAREAALRVAQEGLRWIVGATPAVGGGELAAFEAALNLSAIHRAQTGLISDMDFVADVLYGRANRAAAHVA